MLLYPGEKNVPAVRDQIVQLKEALAAAEKAKSAPPVGTAEPTQIPKQAESPPETHEAPSAKPVVATASPANPARDVQAATPVYKKWWLWTIVGVVVVGGAVTGAVLATRPTKSWANADAVVNPGLTVRW